MAFLAESPFAQGFWLMKIRFKSLAHNEDNSLHIDRIHTPKRSGAPGVDGFLPAPRRGMTDY